MSWREDSDVMAQRITKVMWEEASGFEVALAHVYTPMIEELFKAFGAADLEATDHVITVLERTRLAFSEDTRQNFGMAAHDMEGWHGSAADGFREYLLEMEDAAGISDACMACLWMVLKGYRGLVEAFRKDVVALVQAALKGLEEAEQADLKLGIAVCNAVSGVIGAIGGAAAGGAPKGGAAAAGMGTSIVGALMAGAGGVIIEMVGADSEVEVVGSMLKAGNQLLEETRKATAPLTNALALIEEYVTAERLAEVRPDRPEIITAPSFDPDDFGLTDADQGGHRKPTDTTDLVPEPKRKPDQPGDHPFPGDIGDDRYPEQGPS